MPTAVLKLDESDVLRAHKAVVDANRRTKESFGRVGKSAGDALGVAGKMLDKIRGESRSTDRQVGMLHKTIDDLLRQLKATEKAAQGSGKGLRGHGRGARDAGEKTADFAKRVEIANRLIQKHGIEAGVARKTVAAFGTDLKRADRQALGYAKSLDVATKDAKQFADAQKRAAAETRAVASAEKRAASEAARLSAARERSISLVNSLAGRLVGLALAYGGVRVATRQIGGASKEFGAVQTALVSVAKTTDLTREGVQGLNEDVTELATGAVPILKTELLAIGAAAGQVGVEGRENLAEQIELFGKLSVAAESIDADEAVVELTRLRNVQGELIDVTETQINVLVRLANTFATNERQILTHTSEVGRATSQFKIGSVNALAFGTALSAMGARAEGGGTAIGRAMREIQAAVSEGGEGLEAFADIAGTTSEDFARQWAEDNVGALKTFLEGLGRFGEDSGQALASVGLGSDRLAKVLPVLAENIGLLERAQATASDEASKLTALNKEASAAFNTQDKDVQRLVNTYKFLQEQVGEEMTPSVREMTAAWSAFLADVDAVALGRSLAGALELASGGVLFLAENAGILKVAIVALMTLRIASFLSAQAAQHLAVAGAVTTETVAVQGLTTAQSRFLAVGLTPLAAGLAAVLGAVLLANRAIKNLSRTYENEMADMVKATNAFADSQKNLKVGTGGIIDRGQLQEMSDALGDQSNLLDEARAAAAGFRKEMDDLAQREKLSTDQGNLHGDALERLTKKQDAAALSFNRANTEVGNLEKGTDDLKAAIRKWIPEAIKAGGAAGDLDEEVKKVSGAFDSLQARVIRQDSITLAMNRFSISAKDAAIVVSTLTKIQTEAGANALTAAESVNVLLGNPEDASLRAVMDLVEGLSEANKELQRTIFLQERIASGPSFQGEVDRLLGGVKPGPGRDPFGQDEARVSGGSMEVVRRINIAAEKSDKVFNNFLDGLNSAGQNLEGSLGLFSRGMETFLARSKSEGASVTGLIESFAPLISSLIGGRGPQQRGSLGGLGTGDLSKELGAVGGLFGTIGGLVGQAVGKAIVLKAEEAVAQFKTIAGEFTATVLADSGLSDATRAIARAVIDGVEGFADSLGAAFDLGATKFRIETTGDDQIKVIFDSVETLFGNVQAAIGFAIAQSIRKGSFTGVGPNVEAALAGLSVISGGSSVALDALPSQEDIDELFTLAKAMDEFQSGIGPTGVALQALAVDTKNAVEVAVRFGLDVGAVFELMDAEINRTIDSIQGKLNDLLGVSDHFGAAFDLAQQITDVNDAIVKAEEEGLKRRLELAKRAIGLEEGRSLGSEGAGVSGDVTGIGPTLESVSEGIHSLEELAAAMFGVGNAAGEIAPGIIGAVDQLAEDRRILGKLFESGAITDTELFKELGKLESRAGVAQEQLESLNREMQALEDRQLPDVMNVDLIRQAFDASVLNAGDSLAGLFDSLQGFTADQQALEALRHSVTMNRLRQELINIEIALATTTALSAAGLAAGQAIRQNLLNALAFLEAGGKVARPGGGGRGQARRQEAQREQEEAELAAESFRDRMADLRNELAGVSSSTQSYRDTLEDMREEAVAGAIGVDEMAEAMQLLAAVGLASIIDDWTISARELRASGLEAGIRALGDQARVSKDEARERAGEDPEGSKAALAAIRDGQRKLLEQLGRDFIASIAGPFQTLKKSGQAMVKEIKDAAENLDKLGLSANQLAKTVRGAVLISLVDVAIAEAKRVGNVELLAKLEARKDRLAIEMQLLQLSIWEQMLIAADAMTKGLEGLFDSVREMLTLPDAIAGATDDAISSLAGAGGGVVTTQEVTVSTESFTSLIDSIRSFLTGFDQVGVGQFEAQAIAWIDAFERFDGAISDALQNEFADSGLSGLETLDAFAQGMLGVGGISDLTAEQLQDFEDQLRGSGLAFGSELADLVALFALQGDLGEARAAAVGKLLDLFAEPLQDTGNLLDPLTSQFLDLVAAIELMGGTQEDLLAAQATFLELQARAIQAADDALKSGIRGQIEELQLQDSTQTNQQVFNDARDRFQALAATALDESATEAERVAAVEALGGASEAFRRQIEQLLGAGPTSQLRLDEILQTLLAVNAAQIFTPVDPADLLDDLALQPTALDQALQFQTLTTAVMDQAGLLALQPTALDQALQFEILTTAVMDQTRMIATTPGFPGFDPGGSAPIFGQSLPPVQAPLSQPEDIRAEMRELREAIARLTTQNQANSDREREERGVLLEALNDGNENTGRSANANESLDSKTAERQGDEAN